MTFQDPLSHLNPVYSVGWQIAETMTTHGFSGDAARERALHLIGRLGTSEPRQVLRRVRVMKSGEIVESGPTAQTFTKPRHPYPQRLLAANLVPDPDVQARRSGTLATA
jgi:ABC-type dipeptide/oligopeptide/nickel transport system ATPase component